MLIGSSALALFVAAALLVLVVAMNTLQEAASEERHAKEVTAATLELEKLVLDLETGLRGLVITKNEAFLEPWAAAKRELPVQLERFRELAATGKAQEERARRLIEAIRAYEYDYALPLVAIARTDPAAASTREATAEGRRRITTIRTGFDRFLAAENVRAARTASSADNRSQIAIALGLTALAWTAVLVVAFGLYLARSVARPVKNVAEGASELAAGDLTVRLDERGPAEIGELTRSFNRMAEALARNRTELETQYERLRESEQLKTELIAIVSHELRTPLASMLGFTSLLLQRETDPRTQLHYLSIINAQSRRLASLLDDFLNLQRLEEGRLELQKETVDMATLLREQAQLFSAESDRHRLELRLVEHELPVRGDPDRLAQVVGNLLSNAIKYSPSGGLVEIVGERENGTVRISVRDEGLGIPEDQRDRIFTKFFRGNAAASGIAGSGLGLAFARAVIEAHGGSITFSSESGKGSVFRIELPTQPLRMASKQEPALHDRTGSVT
ncbi:MAG TPA: ATP-binding protein [Gaiellaceae bacterium]|jgi:signal transduction histidine kinase